MRRLLLMVCFAFLNNFVAAQVIQVSVDLSDAPRNIYHSQLTIPVKPGPVTLVYPEWIPGNHRPSGPIANLTGLVMKASGQTLAWNRDPLDMYAFHVDVPAGESELQVALDDITSSGSAGASGGAASANVLDLNWNQVVLYPQGAASDDVQFEASVHLPAAWKFGTALTVQKQTGDDVQFRPVSLTTLVDSPLIAGAHYRQVVLTAPGEAPTHVMDLVSESEAALAITPQDIAAYKKLVAEAGMLFGARHYTQYHFLYTLSDEVGGHGLEHHESNDSASPEHTLIDSDEHLTEAGLLPHEFVHSWNGKYRRPAGLATRNYQDPMVGDLLWVYEGLTEYLGDVLAARSGLWTPAQYREGLAETAAMLDHRTGRTWRPLEDTARSVQILRLGGPGWASWRRGLDYYPEGELIWLEVDATIRRQTGGKKTLNDFCRLFHGGKNSPPKVLPYTFDDVVGALNEVAPFDWATLLKDRIHSTAAHAPLGGIERGGWKLVYDDKPNVFGYAEDELDKRLSVQYSLGFVVKADGELQDVIPGSPAYLAGLGPGMKLVAVNERHWSKAVLRDALRDAKGTDQPIELLVENAKFFKTYSISYHDGEKIPHLVRSDGADILGEILKPLTK